METEKYLEYIVKNIHTVIMATVDDENEPVTCAIDMMDHDSDSLCFLTAKGKKTYERLVKRGVVAFTALKGEDTMHSVAVSIRGKTRELGNGKIAELFEKNPYMYSIYPTEESRKALTVFQIYDGSGEWFDLSKQPVERKSFTFGKIQKKASGYLITSACAGCLTCLSVCPQNCIDSTEVPFVISQENCLHCGNCYNDCPFRAIVKL